MDTNTNTSFPQADLAKVIEHTLLKPEASAADIQRHCEAARQHGFHAVIVHGCRVLQARQLLEDTEIKVGTVVGFPLGANDSDVKRYETEAAVDNGAEEIEVVINVGWLKEGNDRAVLRELRDVVETADERTVKVILETGCLSREEIIRAGHLALDSGAHYVITSTGFGSRSVQAGDVQLLRETLGSKFGIKAAGGIRDWALALALIKAGANRLGTSNGVEILRQAVEASSR
jgi:deoxyribose-phosphate aldolase